jgi:Calcineurin-like phosphoesterase
MLSAKINGPNLNTALLTLNARPRLYRLRILLAAIACITLFSMYSRHAGANILAAWSQYGDRGEVEARLVTEESACPDLVADGRPVSMTERAAPSPAFPVRICVAAIPVGTKRLAGDGLDLPVPVQHPHHIVVFGDTGCRLKGTVVQACNDPTAWPFHAIAERAAQASPDLMIHLGDYLYRETPCRAGDHRCAGTPWGDNWATWNADFFAPAAPLLHRTVWLMARGNHEECSRAGSGFTELLGHDLRRAACNPHESPLLVDLDGVKLALLDDNAALDKEIAPEVADVLRRDITAALAAKADWLVTHHPFRGISKPEPNGGPRVMEGANATLLAALSGADESRLTLMLAGHIHNFQIENYPGDTAPQLVVGEGGDALDKEVPRQLAGLVSGGETVAAGLSIPGFGYVALDRNRHTQDWNITVHAADGRVLRHCALASRKLNCEIASRPPSHDPASISTVNSAVR